MFLRSLTLNKLQTIRAVGIQNNKEIVGKLMMIIFERIIRLIRNRKRKCKSIIRASI